MIVFNDIDDMQAAFRIGDLYEVAHRVRRLGVRNAEVSVGDLQVDFHDPRICSDVSLMIEPWPGNIVGWRWYMHMNLPDSFLMEWLGNPYILHSPYPRQVVREYQKEVRRERRPLLHRGGK